MDCSRQTSSRSYATSLDRRETTHTVNLGKPSCVLCLEMGANKIEITRSCAAKSHQIVRWAY